jgi:hypothetical protein
VIDIGLTAKKLSSVIEIDGVHDNVIEGEHVSEHVSEHVGGHKKERNKIKEIKKISLLYIV